MRQTIIETFAITEGRRFPGCFVFELKFPIDGKRFGVINYDTKGIRKLFKPTSGDFLSLEVSYELRPDAIFICEIL